jgi:hypothetical protein
MKDKWVGITPVIEPALIYPLVKTLLSPSMIQPITSITSQMKCLVLGLNRHFPRAILHGPLQLGGIGVPSTTQKNTKDRLNYFLYNIRGKSSNKSKMEISMIFTQIEVGTLQQFFELQTCQFSHLVTTSLDSFTIIYQ